jgi:hypothetical protein
MFLLSADFLGRDALRRQADAARVIGKCQCGCATIDLWVDSETAPAANVREPIPVEARSQSEEGLLELLLFVRHGWLDSLEIVYYSDHPPTVFPVPDAFDPPQTRP